MCNMNLFRKTLILTVSFASIFSENFFFENGPSVGDLCLREVNDPSDTDAELISETFSPLIGFPFGGEFYYSIYVSKNHGIIKCNLTVKRNCLVVNMPGYIVLCEDQNDYSVCQKDFYMPG